MSPRLVSGRRNAIDLGNAAWLATLSALTLAAFVTIAAADTTANWTSATSGDWTSTSAWSTSPNYPNNGTPSGVDYDATIGATGSAYTVSVDSNVAVDAATVNSADATLNQSSGTFDPGSLALDSGEYEMTGGTLANTTVNLNGGTLAFNGLGTWNNDTVSGGEFVLNNGDVIIQQGLTISDGQASLTDASMYFAGPSETLDNMTITATTGLFFLGAPLPVIDDLDNLTLGPNGVIRGSLEIFDTPYDDLNTFTNNGIIDADTSGDQIQIAAGVFTNNNLVEATNGGTILLTPATFHSSGTVLLDNGTLATQGALKFRGTLTGTGTVTGEIELANNSSTLAFNIGGTSQGISYDYINVDGFIVLGGDLSITLTNGFLPSGDESFVVLTDPSPATITGSFLNVASGGELLTTDGTAEFQVFYGGDGQYANEILLTNYQSVPEPTSAAMATGGICLLALRRSRPSREMNML
jgi:hypothetical protein